MSVKGLIDVALNRPLALLSWWNPNASVRWDGRTEDSFLGDGGGAYGGGEERDMRHTRGAYGEGDDS